jgi:short-subunit dehydrogenase involved in D-alanine esterification of teichoic acids
MAQKAGPKGARKVRFEDLVPPIVREQKVKKQRANNVKPPSLLFTSDETMAFIKKRDDEQKEKEKKAKEKAEMLKEAMKELRKKKRAATKKN